jgi:adenosylcobinamide-GDP ribazoletransferase
LLLICAVQFLTRLPTPRLKDFQPDWIARSARYFPLVGQVVGLISAAVWLLAGLVWPGLPAAVLAAGAGVIATGGFHEDGLADTADGLGGGQSKAQRLEIMKDSRIGSYGAIALGLMLVLKVSLLAGLSPWRGAIALLVAHGGARAAAVMVMTLVPYAGDPAAAKVKPVPEGVRWPEAAAALAFGGLPLTLIGPGHAMLAIALAGGSTVCMALLARRLIGGVTGDVLGAVEQLAEAAILAAVAAMPTP